MNALAPVPDKIVPLVARLGSDSDGERLACLRQLDRVLCRAGITWTDLAARLTAASVACFPPPPSEPDFVLGHWRVAVQWIGSHPDWEPSDRERQFIIDMRRILKRREPSEKQAEWLRGIVERLGGRMDV